MLWAILCFASTTFLPGIASPTSDLFLVTSWILLDTPNWDTTSPHESCLQGAPMGGPISPHWYGSRPTELSAVRHMPPGNRIGGSRTTFEEGRSHKPRSGWMFTKDGHLFGGKWGSLRSDTLCYFVAPLVPMQFLGDSWEDTPHTVTYTTVTHMHTRAHTQSITRKQTNSRNGNKDRAGVTGSWGVCCGDTGNEYEIFENKETVLTP